MTLLQTCVTIYLAAKTADAGLAHHAEQLRLSGVLVAQEANARFVINACKAWVRRRKRSAPLCGGRRSAIVSVEQDTTKLYLEEVFYIAAMQRKMHMNLCESVCNS